MGESQLTYLSHTPNVVLYTQQRVLGCRTLFSNLRYLFIFSGMSFTIPCHTLLQNKEYNIVLRLILFALVCMCSESFLKTHPSKAGDYSEGPPA